MRNKLVNCTRKFVEHIWLLISWIINLVFGLVSFFCRNDTRKIAIVTLIEKALISVLNFLAILDVPICFKFIINKDPIEDCQKLLKHIYSSELYFDTLKELAVNGNKEAEDLINNLNSAGQNITNNLKLNKK